LPSSARINAGTAPSDRFADTEDSVLDHALDLHVRAPFRLLRAALPKMRGVEGACMVQMASTAGLVGFPFTSAYTAAKHGMVGLTRALAAEFGAGGPRVYAVCPGFVDTEITRRAAADIAGRGKQSPEEAMAALGAMNRIGRMHTADEVAAAVLHLVRERPEGCVYNLDQDPPGFV
jgi:3-hydroxybutyrate dehydrogenase